MSNSDEYNLWFCKGAQWANDGQDLTSGLTGLSFAGGTKSDIFAFVKGYNKAKPTPPPPVEPQKEDV